MTIRKKLQNYLNTRTYLKYKKKHCKCGALHWKYLFSPMYQEGVKGVVVARICGECSYKDTEGYFLSDEFKMNNNLIFKIEK